MVTEIKHTNDAIIFGNDEILFDEPSHTYTTPKGDLFTSVTTVIGKYEIPFKRDYWANYKAKERGVPVEVILAEWEETNRIACERGNVIHNFLEDGIRAESNKLKGKNTYSSFSLNKKSSIGSKRSLLSNEIFSAICTKYPKIGNYLIKLVERGYILYAENRICLMDFLLAGTIDLLAIKADFSEFIIVDWKTNKKPLYFKSGYVSKRNGQWVDKPEYFKAPLNFIPHCKGMLYSLQLSTYAHMVESYGIKCKGLALFHVLPDPITKEEVVKAYNIMYMKQAVTDMIKHHHENYSK